MALSTHKIVRGARPEYHFYKMCSEHNYETRNLVKFNDNFAARSERAKFHSIPIFIVRKFNFEQVVVLIT